MFICKLVDESIKDEDDEVEFQYKQGTDTYETLQDRLQRLHRDGMEKFMREEILYVPADYPEWLFLTYTGSKRKSAIEDLRNTIRILKFYSNNEFTFKDVHNEELFYQNGKILVEMVQLFEKYRIVYPSKHQFLGDLFEQLLNKGFKQNEAVIYILTNPSFPEYVKIGYADDIDKRLLQLNRSECIPFAFRVYATYEVNSRLSDLKIHSIIDKLNPNLRSIENFNGKQRIREFYAMSPEDAYSILEAIAEIHGCADKLKRIVMDEAQKQAEETAQEIDDEHKERQSPFRFSMCNIQPGEELEYCNNPEIKCTIVDDKTVSYQGQIYSLSALAQLLTGSKYSVAGPRYFKYRGEWLNDVRHRQER